MTTNNNIFSRVLLDARTRAGLSQNAFAKRFGLKQQTYQNYEKGRVPKDASILKRLADGLGISVDCLLGFTSTYNSDNNSHGESIVKEDADFFYGCGASWKNAQTEFLESILAECLHEHDYGAVAKVADELLNRKINGKLKGDIP